MVNGNDAFGEFGVLLYTVEKTQSEQIRFSLNEFRGREYIDIRTFNLIDGQFRPTKKGVTLGPNKFQHLLHGVVEIGGALNQLEPDLLSRIYQSEEVD